jgi:hypothetical protein
MRYRQALRASTLQIVNLVGAILLVLAGGLLAAVVRAIVRFRAIGGEPQDLRRVEDALKWYEQTPGG